MTAIDTVCSSPYVKSNEEGKYNLSLSPPPIKSEKNDEVMVAFGFFTPHAANFPIVSFLRQRPIAYSTSLPISTKVGYFVGRLWLTLEDSSAASSAGADRQSYLPAIFLPEHTPSNSPTLFVPLCIRHLLVVAIFFHFSSA
jgi:hypothetical protein